MNRLRKILDKIWPFYIQRKVDPQRVMEMMSPFVRAGYNRAITDMEAWAYSNYKDVNFIPYADMLDFMLKQMAEKKIITSAEIIKEAVDGNKKPGAY